MRDECKDLFSNYKESQKA